MPTTSDAPSRRVLSGLRRLVRGPQAIAFLPGLALAAYWFGGEGWMLATALLTPLAYFAAGGFDPEQGDDPAAPRDGVTGLPLRATLVQALDDAVAICGTRGRATAAFLLEIDDFDVIAERHGRQAADDVLRATADRLGSAIRAGDTICRVGPAGFGTGLAPVAHMDLETAIQLAARLQSAVEEPISLGGTVIYVSASIGFCLGARAPDRTGESLLRATEAALDDAIRHAPSAIRSFSAELRRRAPPAAVLSTEVEAALGTGQILAFFQPQISTDTGRVTGFEALARWCHPTRGLIPPADFLPEVEEAGLMERLGEVILGQSLAAIAAWDRAGIEVPRVGVNFAGDELRDPRLIEKIRWQLDRHDLDPGRLTVEVLETVVAASPEDVVSRNINGLAALGCRIDLDDFGTGHASISSIRRFAVERIKIDRSFVMKVDRDGEQQKMVSAILMMAERLGLDTLAEGVETKGEHAMLAQLGCGHVQGFGIARPMPFEQTVDWVRAHESGVPAAIPIRRGSG